MQISKAGEKLYKDTKVPKVKYVKTHVDNYTHFTARSLHRQAFRRDINLVNPKHSAERKTKHYMQYTIIPPC